MGCVPWQEWTPQDSSLCEEISPRQGLTHLLIFNLESGQSGLQLVVPHEQLRVHRLLCADLAHLEKGQSSPCLCTTLLTCMELGQGLHGHPDPQPMRQAQQGQATAPRSPSSCSNGNSRWEKSTLLPLPGLWPSATIFYICAMWVSKEL